VSVELFIYWRLAAADRSDSVAAVARCQSELCERFPGLRAGVYLRTEAGDEPLTLMETYAHALKLDQAMRGLIVEAGDAATARWRAGPRHVETFERLTP
jgi:hypothetical protein